MKQIKSLEFFFCFHLGPVDTKGRIMYKQMNCSWIVLASLFSSHPIVDSDRAYHGLELPRTVFRPYGISKWLRLDSGQVCTVSYGLVHYLCSNSKCVFYIGIIEEIILKTNQCVRHSWLLQYHFYQRVVLSFHNVPIPI